MGGECNSGRGGGEAGAAEGPTHRTSGKVPEVPGSPLKIRLPRGTSCQPLARLTCLWWPFTLFSAASFSWSAFLTQ